MAKEGLERRGDLRPHRDQRRAARRRRAAPGVGARPTTPTASCRSRSRRALARDTDGTLARGAALWKARRPPQRDDQDPGHRRGRAGDRGGDLRGHQRQRHAAVLGRGLRAAWPRPTSAGSSAARRRARASTCTRSRASSSRAWTPRSTSASRTPARTRSCMGTAAVANARAAYQRFKEIFSGERWDALRDAGRAACSARCGPRPGVKNPHYPETKYVDELVAPDTVNTMPMPTLLAAAEHARDRRAPTADQDPTADLERPRRGRDRPGRRHRQAAARRDRRVREVARRAARRASRTSARRSSPAARRPSPASIPNELEPPIAERVKRGGRRGRRAARVAQGRARCGAARARRRSATASAG